MDGTHYPESNERFVQIILGHGSSQRHSLFALDESGVVWQRTRRWDDTAKKDVYGWKPLSNLRFE